MYNVYNIAAIVIKEVNCCGSQFFPCVTNISSHYS